MDTQDGQQHWKRRGRLIYQICHVVKSCYSIDAVRIYLSKSINTSLLLPWQAHRQVSAPCAHGTCTSSPNIHVWYSLHSDRQFDSGYNLYDSTTLMVNCGGYSSPGCNFWPNMMRIITVKELVALFFIHPSKKIIKHHYPNTGCFH